jgi:hypothetical protein
LASGVLDHFNVRSGYAKPVEVIDEEAMEAALRQDARVAAE